MKTYIYGFITAVILCAQQSKGVCQQVAIGEKCPDVQLTNMLHFSKKESRLSEFKGQPILIDFWSTWCTVCVQELPRLDQLQKQFEGQLKVLVVTSDPQAKVEAFFSKHKRFGNISLTMVTGDSSLNKLFPHSSVPHEIWIDSSRVVQAITGHEEITVANLLSFVQGEKINLAEKKDIIGFSVLRPFIQATLANSDTKPPHTYRSIYLGDYCEGLSGQYTNTPWVDKEKGSMKVVAVNVSLSKLYGIAFAMHEWENFHESRIIYSHGTAKFKPSAGNSTKNLFCFEQITTDTSKEQFLATMKEELDHRFSLSSKLEIRKVPCIILARKGKGLSFKNDQGPPETYFTDTSYIAKNVLLGILIEGFFGLDRGVPYPVINCTGYTGRVTMELPRYSEDFDSWLSALRKYGLDARIEEREMKVVVLQDDSLKSAAP